MRWFEKCSKRLMSFFLAAWMIAALTGCVAQEHVQISESVSEQVNEQVSNQINDEINDQADQASLPIEGAFYYDVKNVVLYLYLYEELPDNYITKAEARELGWEGGSVERYREDAAIGGDTFGNKEGLLPKESERTYTECDIDTLDKDSRGAKRLVFSNDGLYFYTEDHYESFNAITITQEYEVIW